MKEALLAAGFKPFKQRVLGHESAAANYQKTFSDDKGKQYFITVYEYDLSDILNKEHFPNPVSFQFDAQFHQEYRVVNIGSSAKEVEELAPMLAMFDLLWRTLGSVYYDCD